MSDTSDFDDDTLNRIFGESLDELTAEQLAEARRVHELTGADDITDD